MAEDRAGRRHRRVRGDPRGAAGALPVGGLPRHAGARAGAATLAVRQGAADLAPDAIAAGAAGRRGVPAAAPLPRRRRSGTPPAAGRTPVRPVRPVPGVPRRLAGRLGGRARPDAQRARRGGRAAGRPALAGGSSGARSTTACRRRCARPAAPPSTANSCASARRAPRRPASCRAGWSCSASRRCRTRPCRRSPRCRATARCCWRCPIPASSTGATSSKGASC